MQLVCDRDLSDHDLRIVGAYQGIFLSRLRDLCAKAGIGDPHRFKIEFADLMMLSCDLKDGYYVVMLLDSRANEGLAWHKLSDCKEKLIAEM